MHTRLIIAALALTCLYLLFAWGAVIAVDIHRLGGLPDKLLHDPDRHPLLWVNLFDEGGPTERLQWLLLACGVIVCLTAWARARNDERSKLAVMWLVIGAGTALMLVEDSLDIRHILAERIFFGTRDGRHVPKALWELAFFGLLGAAMTGPMVVLLRRIRPRRRVISLVAGAYAVYAVAAVSSALRHAANIYVVVGSWIIETGTLARLPAWQNTGEALASVTDGLDSTSALAVLIMDLWIEESLELLGAGLLVAALLAVRGHMVDSEGQSSIHTLASPGCPCRDSSSHS